MPLLIDSGTAISVLPSTRGELGYGERCVELRAAGGLLAADIASLAQSTAAFRLLDAPVVEAPGDEIGGWTWSAGDELQPARVGGVIGGNLLRDFALELRHFEGQTPSLAFFGEFPGSEEDLADQGRAYLRLQFPGRLLGRLIDDRCELGPNLGCELDGFNLDQNNQSLLFESTRALLDACVSPPPCAVAWRDESCALTSGGAFPVGCPTDAERLGESATLVVATGVPGLVLIRDSAQQLFGALESLPGCDEVDPSDYSLEACLESIEGGSLTLPGWPPLTGLTRLRVRSLGLLEGLDQASGRSPCQRLRRRLEGALAQCEGFAAEGRPVRPNAASSRSVSDSALVVGEASLAQTATGPQTEHWIPTLVVPESAAPIIALRREIVPEGAQPDGLVGSALLRNTEIVLDFTESDTAPGVRARCLDPGSNCLALPACSPDGDEQVEHDNGAAAGRASCCHGLPTELISEVVLAGQSKTPPRLEDACCGALPAAAIRDLQSAEPQMCVGFDAP